MTVLASGSLRLMSASLDLVHHKGALHVMKGIDGETMNCMAGGRDEQ